jgi:hypothetical protein
VQTEKRLASESATAWTSPATVQTSLGAAIGAGSTTFKASNGAGRELHNRAHQGLAGRHACHGAFTFAQVIDFQGKLSA